MGGSSMFGSMFESIASAGEFAGSIWGSKKLKAPKFAGTYLNPETQTRDALTATQNTQAQAQQVESATNTFEQGQANSMMEQALPGWSKLQGKLMSTTNDLLTNPYDLPADVQQNLERISAEKGISAGTRGQFNDFSLLRDLGVNELQYGQSRIQQAGNLSSLLASTAPRVSPMSPLSYMVTPGQETAATMQNNDYKQAQENANVDLNNFKTMMLVNANSQYNAQLGAIWGGAFGAKTGMPSGNMSQGMNQYGGSNASNDTGGGYDSSGGIANFAGGDMSSMMNGG